MASKIALGIEFGRRRRGALDVARKAGLDGLLVTHLPDIRYLCGFSGSSGMLFVMRDKTYLLTDFRYREQSRIEAVGVKAVICDDGFAEGLREVLESRQIKAVSGKGRGGAPGGKADVGADSPHGTAEGAHRILAERAIADDVRVTSKKTGHGSGDELGGENGKKDGSLISIGFDPEHLAYAEVIRLRRHLRGLARLVAVKKPPTSLRALKSNAELAAMRKGIYIAEKAFREALGATGDRCTEAALAAKLDAAARRMGAESPSFETIVASGKRGALVHARPSRNRLSGVAVIDWGIVLGGYCTDSTRTVAFGRVPAELRKAHSLVLEAQERALKATRPGVKAREVDRAARELIQAAGYGKAFGHGLGHGVGLEVHERPYVGPRSDDVLEEGMVFTIEPGIYLPGVGGVRVEDMAVVTRDGAEFLTALPRTLYPADYL
ncbi:MAG: M24 family metallopeptidase [Actinobacteria bacterium]|nr:M24 family metallopeptidase [Actinomycetota bacterium]